MRAAQNLRVFLQLSATSRLAAECTGFSRMSRSQCGKRKGGRRSTILGAAPGRDHRATDAPCVLTLKPEIWRDGSDKSPSLGCGMGRTFPTSPPPCPSHGCVQATPPVETVH